MKFYISMNYKQESFNLTVSYLDKADHRLNKELDLQSLFGLHVHGFTYWLRPRNPPPRISAHIRGRCWSAKIDDISV
jgi:hypothetical protein